MCFIIKNSKLRIALKDIECYKKVDIEENYCISECMNFKYEFNKIYSNKSKLTLLLRYLFDNNITSEGYHSYSVPFHFTNVKCIIPKGSLYLKNKYEYCSTSIIIKRPYKYE